MSFENIPPNINEILDQAMGGVQAAISKARDRENIGNEADMMAVRIFCESLTEEQSTVLKKMLVTFVTTPSPMGLTLAAEVLGLLHGIDWGREKLA